MTANTPYFERIPGGGKAFMHFCACGAFGSFGEHVNLKNAILRKDAKLAGTWFCGPCWRDRNTRPEAVKEAA